MFKKFRQYFAPDNGEIAGSADLPTDDVTDVALDEGTSYEPEMADEPIEDVDDEPIVEEKPVQTPEENAKYAAARREAEAREKAVRDEQANMDRMVQQMFGNYTNPITGEKVTGVKSYFEALNAQQQYHAQQEIEKAGLNPNLISELINNNPVILQAQEVLAKQEAENTARQMQSEIDMIHALDASINTPEDLLNMENFDSFKGYVDKGYSFIDAYKLSNFERLQQKNTDAAKQAAINKAKTTSHLQSTNGLSAGGEELKEIPTAELAMWREIYPDLPMSELKEKYNKSLKF